MKRKPLIYSCPDCGKTILKSKVESLLNDEEKENFQKFERQNKVDLDPNLFWCPRVDWDKYVYAGDVIKNQKQKATCDWTFDFCINCHMPWHEKKDCNQLKDKGVANLQKKAILKTCPKWNTNIEKNKGCNHMTWGVWGHKFDWVPEIGQRNQRENNQNNPSNWSKKCEIFIYQCLFVIMIWVIWPLSCWWTEKIKEFWRVSELTWTKFIILTVVFFFLTIPGFVISLVIFTILILLAIIIFGK